MRLEWSSSRYRRERCRAYVVLAYTVQVLTGETPFRGVRRAVLGLSVVRGLRPEKPADSPAIWFSDALWTFVQRCWDRDRNSRPRVTEVVMYLAEAAANSRGLMPPCGKSKSIACVSDESMSRTMKHSKFKPSTSFWYCL